MSKIFQTQNQMIIRFPEDVAERLNKYFSSPDNYNAPGIQIQIDPSRQKQLHSRLALKVHVDDQTYKATVMQLPTVSSTFKTIDRINFFKSNDISEMVVVHDKYQDQENIREDQAQKIVDKQTGKVIKYKMESGLTEPTKFIKQNNYRIKPQIDLKKVSQVDREMEKIRSQNAVQNKDDKSSTGGRKRKV